MKKAWITPEDYIPGTPGDDTLTGTSGRDTLDGGTGADLMTGGDGNDTYIVDNVGDVVVEVADGGRDTVRASISYTLASKVEKLVLTGGGNIDGTGNGQHNILTGNGGHNELSGRAGNDQLYGGLGNDTLIGGNGKDLLVGGSGVNDLHDAAGDGADTIDGTGGVDTLFADWSAVTTDIVWHNNPAATVTVLGNTITSMEMMVVDLGSGNDVVRTAGGWRDVVHGNGGNDNLGAPHRGDLWGDSGNDTLTGGVESNLHGGDGDDELFESASFGSGSCSGDGGNDTIHANGSRSAVSGGDGNDLILGGDGHNPMSGGAGNDTLYGGLGEDGLYGDAGDDWLSSGGTGFAVGTEDGLNGGDGNDTLVSAASFERMTGGTGTDLFLFGSAVWERGDWVMDFVSGTDKIGIAQSTLAIGDGDTVIEGAVAVAGPGGFATSAELVIITNPTGDAPSSIGSANSNYAVGDSVVFGVGSRIYVFTSMDGDAAVELNELDMVAVLDPLGPDNPTTQIGDYTFV